MASRPISVEVDRVLDSAYVRLSNEPVARTVEVTDEVLVDLDSMEVVVGIEVLSLAATIPHTELSAHHHVHSDVINVLRQITPSVGDFLVTWASESSATPTRTQSVARSKQFAAR